VAREAAFPPFIPPSLKTLAITQVRILESLFRELPSMLQASGARLERIRTESIFEVSLAPVLRTCSSTLKAVQLCDFSGRGSTETISELVGGLMSCCATLEVLICPWSVFSALPATCPAFPRLTTLRLEGANENVEWVSPAWDIMANGRLPALATLHIKGVTGRSWGTGENGGEGKRRLGRAFEAVGGTLRRLTLVGSWGGDLPAGACYELGAAIGKLRRLMYLSVSLSDGQYYHAVGRGVAASGGCPELFEIHLKELKSNTHCLAYEPSLIVPSVRDLDITADDTEAEALLLCCGLVQTGYKHRLRMGLRDQDINDFPPSLLNCMRATLCAGGVNVHMY
jgi:hypothetical protein